MLKKLSEILMLIMTTAALTSPVFSRHLEKDIPYYEKDMPRSGDTSYLEERCRLDISCPEGGKDLPAVIYFHGGGLKNGGKFIPEELLQPDFIVVAPNYRLSSSRASCPDYLNDAGAATAWVLRNIRRYGGDPRLVFVSGTSAGGYLSAMIGMDDRWLKRYGHSNTELAGLMPISGQMSTHFQILNERRTKGLIPDSVQTVVDEFAPVFHTGGPLPPLWLYTGDRTLDWPARTEENAWLAAVLRRREHRNRVFFHELQGFDHGSVSAAAFQLIAKEIRRQRLLLRQRSMGGPGHRIVTAHPVRLPFVGRNGDEAPHRTEAVMSIEQDCLKIVLICREPRMTQTVRKEAIYESDSVELFLEAEPGSVGQWVMAADGRSQFFGYDMQDPGAACRVERLADRWEAQLRIPLKSFPGIVIRGNFIRNRLAGGSPEQSCLAPIAGRLNRTPESFITLILLPEL